jgi:hypothetical protein
MKKKYVLIFSIFLFLIFVFFVLYFYSIKLVPPIFIKGSVVTEKGVVIENFVGNPLGDKMFLKVKKLILSMKKGLGCDYVQVSVVGKEVPHFHIHLIPRHFNDGLKGWDTLSYEDGEIEQLADKIRN